MNQFRDYLNYEKETGIFTWIKKISKHSRGVIGSSAGSTRKDGYARVRFNKKDYLAHRLAWFFYYEKWPSKDLDHKNGNRSDNRIENLREATSRENASNRTVHRNGKLLGATKINKKWQSNIQIFKKLIHLGRFHTEQEASNQYFLALENQDKFNGNPEDFRKLLKTLE